MQPLVSIGMPVFNCEKTLIPTVRSLLNQTYANWELLLIDDGSKDNTLLLSQSFDDSRIRVISDGVNMKLPIRLNQAIDLSRGKYFARMDGGDITYPERLEAQVRYLEGHPNIDLVGSRIIVFNGEGHAVGSYAFKQTHAEICRRPWASFYLPHPTWMGKIKWFRTNRYRAELIKSQDQELLLRTYKNSCFACMPDILLGYRKRSLSLKNILTGRYHFSVALLQKAILDKHYFLAFGVLEHALKALIEVFAITTGLNYRVLQHRSIPVQQAEVIRWQAVWADCNSSET
jgi:glycosyltransferase involved in cell wall biosynthesis